MQRKLSKNRRVKTEFTYTRTHKNTYMYVLCTHTCKYMHSEIANTVLNN